MLYIASSKRRIIENEAMSGWGQIPGPVLFTLLSMIWMQDWKASLESSLMIQKVGGGVEPPVGQEVLQRDQDRLEH